MEYFCWRDFGEGMSLSGEKLELGISEGIAFPMTSIARAFPGSTGRAGVSVSMIPAFGARESEFPIGKGFVAAVTADRVVAGRIAAGLRTAGTSFVAGLSSICAEELDSFLAACLALLVISSTLVPFFFSSLCKMAVADWTASSGLSVIDLRAFAGLFVTLLTALRSRGL